MIRVLREEVNRDWVGRGMDACGVCKEFCCPFGSWVTSHCINGLHGRRVIIKLWNCIRKLAPPTSFNAFQVFVRKINKHSSVEDI